MDESGSPSNYPLKEGASTCGIVMKYIEYTDKLSMNTPSYDIEMKTSKQGERYSVRITDNRYSS